MEAAGQRSSPGNDRPKVLPEGVPTTVVSARRQKSGTVEALGIRVQRN